MPLATGIDYLHRNLRRFMRPTRRGVALPMRLGRARIEYQPLGMAGPRLLGLRPHDRIAQDP